MGRIEQEEIPCPFCGIGKIPCDHVPSMVNVKVNLSATVGKIKKKSKSSDIWNIKSSCSNCGKTADEIKKAMKEGIPPDKEKLKRRYEDIMKLREEMRKKK